MTASSGLGIRLMPLLAVIASAQIPRAVGQAGGTADGPKTPLARKQEIVRNRYERLIDRMYRLQEQLSETERDNAARLARAIERAGALGLQDRLDELIEVLDDGTALGDALTAQQEWLSSVDKVLAILLERDGNNEERRQDIERLEGIRRDLRNLLDEQRSNRDATAGAALATRLQAQLDEALNRLDALIERQDTARRATPSGPEAREEAAVPALAERQAGIAEDAARMAEDVERMAALADGAGLKGSEAQGGEDPMGSAAEELGDASEAAAEAARRLQDDDPGGAQRPQEEASESLRRARDRLARAKEELDARRAAEGLAEAQRAAADKARALADRMREGGQRSEGSDSGGPQDGQPTPPGGAPTPPDGSGAEPAPGREDVEQAEGEMRGAAEELDEGRRDEAVPHQDRAIDALEEALQELDDTLLQQRRDEREETLRSLETRFREMRRQQASINEATVSLDRIGADSFGRAERLRLAELSTQQLDLSDRATGSVHILDEEATTIVFPRVIAQLAEDMTAVAGRLGQERVGALTQTIEAEILETLDQLLEATQRMQRENEQQQQQQRGGSTEENTPLLPRSAELKLLKASQLRVNTRTTAIEQARVASDEPLEALQRTLESTAQRQRACAAIAQEMRDRQQQP